MIINPWGTMMVFQKTPALCDYCFKRMRMRKVDVGVSPTKERRKVSVLLMDVGHLWKFMPEICEEAKAKCHFCNTRAKWLFDHLNENFLPVFKAKGIDNGAYFFFHSSYQNISELFGIEDEDILDHRIGIINGNHFKNTS